MYGRNLEKGIKQGFYGLVKRNTMFAEVCRRLLRIPLKLSSELLNLNQHSCHPSFLGG